MGQSSIPLIESAVSHYLSGDFDSCLFIILDHYSTNDHLNDNERISLLSRASLIAAWYGNDQIANLTSIDADSLEGLGLVPDSTAKADKLFLQAIREYNKSNLTKASELLLRSEQLRSQNNKFERAVLADTYGFHGWVYKTLNDYAKAITYYTKAISLDRELFRRQVLASELTELASTRMALDPNDPLIDTELGEALEIYQKDKNYPYLAVVNNEYGALFRNRGDLPLALDYFLKSAQIKEKNNFTSNLDITYNNIGALYENMNQTDSSIYYIRKAIDIVNPNISRSLSQYYYNLGSRFGKLGLPDSALNYFDLAIQELLPEGFSLTDSSLYSFVNPQMPGYLAGKATELYNFYIKSGDLNFLKQSIHTYNIVLHQLDRLRFLYSFENKAHAVKENRQYYFLALQYAAELYTKTLNQDDLQKAFLLAGRSKGLVFDEYMRVHDAREFFDKNSDLIRRDDSLKMLKTVLLRKTYEFDQVLKDSISKYQSQIFDIDNKLSVLSIEIEEKNPSYHQAIHSTQEYSSDLIKKKLGDNQLLLDFTWHKNQIIIIAIGSNEFELHIIDVPSDLREIIGKYSKFLNGWPNLISDKEFKSVSWNLYSTILESVEPLIQDKDLYIIPDDSLALLPFETLLYKEPDDSSPDYSKLPYLIKKNSVSYYHSIQQFVLTKNNIPLSFNGVSAFAPFEKYDYYDGTFNLGMLVGSKEEIRAIKRYLPTKLYESEKATENNFRHALSKPRIIHVATHGLQADSTPLQNHILFYPRTKKEDNKFSLFELLSMQVESPLIVLSSCNTGAGTFQPGEGVLSLARAFHFAGAPSLVMSQWPVDDAASVIIMDNFYRGIKEGLSLTKSLKQAKCFYIETAGKVKANPSYWASFQLTGYSDKIVIKETIENKSYLILGLGIVIFIIILLTVRLYIKNKNL